MKQILTILTLLLFTTIIYGQDSTKVNSFVKQATTTKITLTSPLDRLTKVPKFNSPATIKQRSIFSVQSLPIFCKIEHKLAKSSKVNVMMRLGSLDYVNKLEGKQ